MIRPATIVGSLVFDFGTQKTFEKFFSYHGGTRKKFLGVSFFDFGKF